MQTGCFQSRRYPNSNTAVKKALKPTPCMQKPKIQNSEPSDFTYMGQTQDLGSTTSYLHEVNRVRTAFQLAVAYAIGLADEYPAQSVEVSGLLQSEDSAAELTHGDVTCVLPEDDAPILGREAVANLGTRRIRQNLLGEDSWILFALKD